MADLFVSYVVDNFRTEQKWFDSMVVEFERPVATSDDISALCQKTGDLSPYKNLTILYWHRMEEAKGE